VRDYPFDLPMAAERLVPQRPPMLAIDRLTEFQALQGGVVESTMAPDSIFVRDDGSVGPAVLVELIAQAFAAVKGYEDLIGGSPVAKGFLVEVKRFEVFGTAHGGDKLSIIIKKAGETDDFALAHGTVMREGAMIASGNVMVWIRKEAS
jgi:3-hydroxyacyl-[acyl-carrier-protein] dehydratase